MLNGVFSRDREKCCITTVLMTNISKFPFSQLTWKAGNQLSVMSPSVLVSECKYIHLHPPHTHTHIYIYINTYCKGENTMRFQATLLRAFRRTTRPAYGLSRFRCLSTSTAPKRHFNSQYGFILGATGVTLSTVYFLSKSLQSDDATDSVSVINSVDALPMTVKEPLQTNYDLIGYGIREVSFLKFKVYALGLYIAHDDVPLVSSILNSKFLESFYEDDVNSENQNKKHSENLSVALSDPNVSNILIKNLISSGVRFTARICAIRNTDLSHLRDGFIRTIKNNPNYKKIMKEKDQNEANRVIHGLDELRDVFNSAKVSARKNSLVYMEIDENQYIRVSVQTADKNGKHNEPRFIGTVHEPLVTELLFESYLGAEKPLVKSVQETCKNSLVTACS